MYMLYGQTLWYALHLLTVDAASEPTLVSEEAVTADEMMTLLPSQKLPLHCTPNHVCHAQCLAKCADTQVRSSISIRHVTAILSNV